MNYALNIVSLDELDGFVAFIRDYIKISDVIGLEGGLGAGKTTFVKAFLKSFNYNDTSSPTFSIINEYTLESFKIIHADFYRIDDPTEFIDYIKENRQNAISFVEWPKGDIYNKKLSINPIGENKRLYKLCM